MEIKKLSESVPGSGNFVLYGPSGSGKTHSLQTLPVAETLIINLDRGLRTLKDSFSDCDVATIECLQDLTEVFYILTKQPEKYKYVPIDSLSELAELALADAKTKSKDGRKHYGLMAEKVTAMIKTFNELPQTMIWIAEEERVNPEMAGELDYLLSPAIPGKKFAAKLPYKFDYVFAARTHKDENDVIHRRFQTSLDGTGVYLAKSRLSREGQLEIFEMPDWGEIFKKLT